jgi:hypothetical protein
MKTSPRLCPQIADGRPAANAGVAQLARLGLAVLALTVLLLAGCAFDVSHLNQTPVAYTPVAGVAKSFVLSQDVKVSLGTGFPTRLNAGTRWRQVGSTEHGEVFATADQIVTVEASNISEAQLVVANNFIKGFYLPVEKTFAPVRQPISIATKPIQPNQP